MDIGLCFRKKVELYYGIMPFKSNYRIIHEVDQDHNGTIHSLSIQVMHRVVVSEHVLSLCFLQRTSYLTQHRRGHSGDAVYGWPAVPLQAREGSLLSGALVVQSWPALAARAEGAGTAPAPPPGGQEPHGQPRQQQQRGLGQSGAAQPSQPMPQHQPRDGLPVL